ncbi:MAG: hypothetical protein ACRD22_22660, partial [Terriglobia bacterium]
MADPISDPLQTAANFRYSGSFFPYGFPVYLRSDSSDVLAAAKESWGTFSGRFESKPLELRVLVATAGAVCGKSVPLYRAQRNLLTAVADA